MDRPLVSIITPAFKSEKVIGDTIRSVLNQTYQNWEMIIVDDCSPDNLKEVVELYRAQDSRVKLISHEVNLGVEMARQTAVDNSKGSYIAFLDSDDLWHPEKLEKQVRFMTENDLAFCYTSYQRMSAEGDLVSSPIKLPKKMNYNQLLSNTCIATLTVMVNREKVSPIKFEPNSGYDDFALWLSILKRGNVAVLLPESLAFYRVMDVSISSSKKRAVGWVWHILRDIEGLGFFNTLRCVLGYGVRAFIRRKSYPLNLPKSF